MFSSSAGAAVIVFTPPHPPPPIQTHNVTDCDQQQWSEGLGLVQEKNRDEIK